MEAASLNANLEKEVGKDYSTPSRLNAAYLASRLEYTSAGDRLVDTSTQLAVMMDWERPLMARHAAWICFVDVDAAKRPRSLHTLNVGFGMGIVDEEIMSHAPVSHTIIEAHPQVSWIVVASGIHLGSRSRSTISCKISSMGSLILSYSLSDYFDGSLVDFSRFAALCGFHR